jgi:hypothetical protein
MERLHGASLLLLSVLVCCAAFVCAQTSDQPKSEAPPAAPPAASQALQTAPVAPPIPASAPRISKQTRLQIIRDFETQIFYSRTTFPMGTKGIKLKNGVTTPSGTDLQSALALWGPAVKPGDPAHISFVQIKDDHIHFDINGGAVHRKKWYEHVSVSGNSGVEVPLAGNQSQTNPHGSYLDLYFDRFVPEMTAQQLRDLLIPVLDFNARNKEQAYLDTVPPKAKEAIQAHHILVGMNTEMVLHAKGRPPRKVREKDGETDYEEWIYGEPPQDVDFVRIVGDEVVRVETMRVGGQKIVRTEREVILEKPDRDTEAKKGEQDRQPNAPSLRRPGEDPDNAPRPADGPSRTRPAEPAPPPSRPSDPGPGELISGHI